MRDSQSLFDQLLAFGGKVIKAADQSSTSTQESTIHFFGSFRKDSIFVR